MTINNIRYVALLRGINVGGHHKVPMASLRAEMESLGFDDVTTLLNSGNIVFCSHFLSAEELEVTISGHLEKISGFGIPVLVRQADVIQELVQNNPFEQIHQTTDTRLYISFLKELPASVPPLPWVSDDGSYRILEIRGRTICSVLDLAVSPTPKGMDALEQLFGKNITTRNWNTINRIAQKLN